VHWIVGTVSKEGGIDLHLVYRVASLAVLAALVLVVHRLLVALRLGLGACAICLGLLVASVYPFRYQLAAPGMIADGVFLLGLAIVALGFAEERDVLVVAGAALAAVGRQTALPLAVAAALVLLARGRGRRAGRAAILTVLAAAAVFATEWLVSRSFALPQPGGLRAITLVGSLVHPLRLLTREQLASWDARCFIGLILPAGVIAGLWLRGRRPRAALLFLAASVIAQPLVLSPSWVGRNESRLAALALPALVLVVAE
jgi:hypothetical protein